MNNKQRWVGFLTPTITVQGAATIFYVTVFGLAWLGVVWMMPG